MLKLDVAIAHRHREIAEEIFEGVKGNFQPHQYGLLKVCLALASARGTVAQLYTTITEIQAKQGDHSERHSGVIR